MRRNIQENGITEGVIWKQLLAFFFPILLGTFFQQLYNTVDAIVVGQFVGKEALAAVGGATGTIINLLVGFFVGLSSGATVIISQYYGARNPAETNRAVHTAAALSLAGGAILMVIGIMVAPMALKAMGTPDDIMDYSVTYMRVYFLGIIPNLIYNMGAGVLRAIGDSKRPLYFLIASCMVNVVLDLLFVLVFRLEVLGAALATILSQLISAVLVTITLMRSVTIYQLSLKDIRFDRPMLVKIIQIGLPAGLQSVLYSVSNLVIQVSINHFGTDTVAAWTAYGKIDGLFWMIMGAFGIAITTFTGQNFGAQKYDRIRKSLRVSLAMAMGTAVGLTLILLAGGQYIYLLFTQDTAVLEIGMDILHALVPFYFTYVSIEIFSGAVRGTGDSLIPTIITCVGVCVIRLLWVVAAELFHSSLTFVLMSYPVSWAITSVCFIVYYLQGGWLRRRVRAAGFPEEGLEKK